MAIKQSILNIDPSESIDFEVLRHPVGLVPIYLTGGLVIGALVAMAAVTQSAYGIENFPDIFRSGAFLVLVIILSALVVVATLIAVRIYLANELVVTSENLIQIQQTSLFSTAVSQLSLEKVQDVTSIKHGIFASMFNFGTIQVETAGEKANFSFTMARDPVIAAKHINEAHERFIKKYGIDVI